jgi:glycosyltransferase involved in cell wall biosynthesis
MAGSPGAPLVTVTIPTYNRADLLHDTIRSVLDQSVKDIELFVSDNASTDHTGAVVDSFHDSRVRYVRNDTNLGHLVNMSRGLRFGTAPFLTILPDDDLMLPGHLERKLDLLHSDPRLGLAHSASKLVHIGPDSDVLSTTIYYTGGRTDSRHSGAEVLRGLLTDATWINFPTAVIRRSVIGDARFDEADGLADDLGMFLRLMRRVDAVAYVAEPLVALRMHVGAVSSGHAFHELRGRAYHPTFVTMANIRDARRRFLDQYGGELEDAREIRASSRRWIRSMLFQIAKAKSAEPRSPLTRCAVLLDAAKVDPNILLSPQGMVFLRRSVIGPEAFRLSRRVKDWIAT